MRLIALFLAGLFTGFMCALMVANALRENTRFEIGLMAVMGHHQRALDGLVRGPAEACSVEAATHHLRQLAAAGLDLERAFPVTNDDALFAEKAQGFRAAIASGLEAPLADCAAVAAAAEASRSACTACHTPFRG
jgi:cytochrome c556